LQIIKIFDAARVVWKFKNFAKMFYKILLAASTACGGLQMQTKFYKTFLQNF
jgi:hypothetical protein